MYVKDGGKYPNGLPTVAIVKHVATLILLSHSFRQTVDGTYETKLLQLEYPSSVEKPRVNANNVVW